VLGALDDLGDWAVLLRAFERPSGPFATVGGPEKVARGPLGRARERNKNKRILCNVERI
jgi:hypothetical protein